MSDTNVVAMLAAAASVDRNRWGFTPISTNMDVSLQTASGRAYDTMLHMRGRTIAFRKTQYGYRWVAEHETHYGPKMCTDIDGTFQEHIVLEYQVEPVNGVPTNQLQIYYFGNDSRLTRGNLSLDVIRPILQEWKGTPIQE